MPTKQRRPTLAVGQIWQSNLPSDSGVSVIVRRIDPHENHVYFEYMPPTNYFPFARLDFAMFCRDFNFAGQC